MTKFILRWVINAIALFAAVYIVPGVTLQGGAVGGLLADLDAREVAFAARHQSEALRFAKFGDDFRPRLGRQLFSLHRIGIRIRFDARPCAGCNGQHERDTGNTSLFHDRPLSFSNPLRLAPTCSVAEETAAPTGVR